MNGSLAILVVAIAASGYILASQCVLNRYRIARQSGHRLYLSSLTYGVYALFPALLITQMLSFFLAPGNRVPFLAFCTIAFAMLFTEIYNRKPQPAELKNWLSQLRSRPFKVSRVKLKELLAQDEQRKTKALWEAWQQNDIELICAHAMSEFKPVAITLDTQKVYVGIVADTIEPSDTESYLSILPLYSGYRDNKTHKLKLNHKYSTLIKGLIDEDDAILGAKLDYVIAIPLERIVTIHVFNENLYQEVSGHSTEEINTGTTA